jgi:hypothetical protein
MAYIGRPLNAGNLAVQSGTGDGSDTTPIATLDYSVGSSNSIAVYLDGVRQLAGTDFTASGTALTFTTAPANGVGVDVYFLGLEVSIPTPADGTISTAKIVDNAVTLAKMAGGTDGQIITYDASGDPVAVGPGTDGQVLTSTGAGSPPAFEDASGGAWAVKSSGTFSTSSAVNFTGLTKTTKVFLTAVTGSVDGAEISIRTSTNNGSSYDSGGSDYEWYYIGSNGGAIAAGSATESYFRTKNSLHTTQDTNLEFTIYDPASATQTIMDTKTMKGGGSGFRLAGGVRVADADVDAVSLYANSGTITGSYICIELN